MNFLVPSYMLWLFAITALTFFYWFRPNSFFADWSTELTSKQKDLYLLISCFLGILFFLSCFLLGVGISIVRMKGSLL